jgi:AraC family transcriptional regulator of adaptative response / DNA-3-methyladenine glycosylase II
MNRKDVYFEAFESRDHRFDGKFFVGVKTTGIYCRPICPAKPKRENVEFFPNQIEAKKAGYRPCLRCRPEAAPRSPAWIGKSAVVRRAVRSLQDALELDEDAFAARFGLTARHLRRLFNEEIGKTPKQLFFESRLNLARSLITETSMPLAEVAFASGFGSIRRFNDAFKGRFKRSPGEIRRSPIKGGLTISLPYRPPYDFSGLLHFYRTHAVGELESFTADSMSRVVALGGRVGEIRVSNDEVNSRLLVEIDLPDTSLVHGVVGRVRALFDLDSDPVVIANSLEVDPGMKKLVKKHPGVRLPSGWDPFETAVASILGQLVSVERGRALLADLIEMLGEEIDWRGRKLKLFPSPEKIAASELHGLKTTGARKRALREFSRAVAEGRLSLEPTQDVEEFIGQALRIPGIGPWTATYMAMKALRHTDSFPETDLILARALELHPKELVDRMSPWRGYAAALFWREYTMSLKKSRTAHKGKKKRSKK